MKILLVGNVIEDQQRSMLAFGQVLWQELQARGHQVRLEHPPLVVARFARSAGAYKWLGYIDKFLIYPWRLRKQAAWAEVVHVCDHSNGMYVPHVRKRPNLITCHDVIAIQAAKGMIDGWNVSASGRLFQRLISRGLGRAQHIACVSQNTQRDLIDLEIAPAQRTSIVVNGLNADFHPEDPSTAASALRALGVDTNTPFLLHVGVELPRKNRLGVLRAFAALTQSPQAQALWPDLKLVYIGPALTDEMRAFAEEHRLIDRIQVLQDVSTDVLRSAYSMALVLMFPSTSEGFGWPIIEAQACGCPVLTSDLAPMNQIGGDAAMCVDPHDPQAMADTLIANAPRLEEIREKGLRNAAHYTKAGMIDAYEQLYRQLARPGA